MTGTPGRLTLWYRSLFDGASMAEIRVGTAHSLGVRLAGSAFGVLLSIVIARSLGASGAGVYYLAVAIATLGATVSRLGLDNAIVRFVAASHVNSDYASIRYVYRLAVWVVFLASSGMAALLVLASPVIDRLFFSDAGDSLVIAIAAVSIVPLAIVMVQAEALRGLKRILESQLLKSMLIALLTLVVVLPLIRIWSSTGAVGSFAIATTLVLLVGVIFWPRQTATWQESKVPNSTRVTASDLFRTSWPLFAVTLSGLMLQVAPILSVGYWADTASAGIFNVANRLTALISLPLLGVISILAPKLSELHSSNLHSELASVVRRTTAILIVYAVPAMLLAWVLTVPILELFGDEFVAGADVMRILLIGVVINVITGPVSNLLMMTGNETDVRNVTVAGAALLLLIGVLLVPGYGALGAALTVSTVIVLQNLVMTLVVRARLGFWVIGPK